MTTRVEVLGIRGIGEVAEGTDLAGLIAEACAADGTPLQDGDVVVVASKVVAKAEGCAVPAGDDPEARRRSLTLAEEVLVETPWVAVVRTAHGYVCANAGIDASNVPGGGLLLLPEDPDASAAAIRTGLADVADVAVVVTDTFGRAWREGQTDVALGVAGLPALRDERGGLDREGRPLSVTLVALADQVAGAADLVRDKAAGIPVVVLRGLGHLVGGDVDGTAGSGADLVRPPATDLFPHGRGWLARRLATGEGAPVRGGPPAAWEWSLVAAAVEGQVAEDGASIAVADGLAAGRAEACLLDLGYAAQAVLAGDRWVVEVG